VDLSELIDQPEARARVSASELARFFLDRIEKRTPHVHAVVTPTAELALADAGRIDAARTEGRPLPLDGMPIVLKDNIDIAGIRGALGSKIFFDRRAERNATVVDLLRKAGAIILGKAQTTEFMYALASHPVHESCLNPWDPARIAGASSSGSGSALGDDQCLGALGTDTGGSVRIPAAFCGVSGLRPTYGVVSGSGVFPLAASFDVVGPMARSAADVGALFNVLAQFDPADPRSVRTSPQGEDASTVRHLLRIGLPRQFFYDDCEPEIAAAVGEAVKGLERLGHRLKEIDLPLAYSAHEGFTQFLRAEALTLHWKRIAAQAEDFSVDVRDRLKLGEAVSARDLVLIIADLHAWRRQLEQVFEEEVDVIATPTTQCAPPLLADAKLGKLPAVTRLTYPWSFGALPAMSAPCGLTRQGLPVGLQISARPHADRLLIALARQYQAETDWHRRRPGGGFSSQKH
jgi:aspartyl-tRNA(Asn)/glutamyl-tRNA(Gln) amidotransferase subunit A